MGYSTEFKGSLEITGEGMNEELMNYINKFSECRHIKRNPDKIKEFFPYWQRDCFKGDLGIDGSYFIGEPDLSFSQSGVMHYDGNNLTDGKTLIDYNTPPKNCPGLWCQWVVSEENGGYVLEWDGGEKFYHYIEWLNFLIQNFFEPCECVLNGEIKWQGEDMDDRGMIYVNNNKVTTEDLD